MAIHKEHLHEHYHQCGLSLDKLLRKHGGLIEERIINALYKELAEAMDFLLERYPGRFVRKEIKTGKRGPKTAYIQCASG